MTSLRKIILTRVTLLLTLVSLATATTSYVLVRLEANGFLDNQLTEVARNAGVGLEDDAEPPADPELEDRLVVQIWDRDGNLIRVRGPEANIPAQKDLGFSDVSVGGEDWRIYRASDAQRVIQISQRWSAREEIATRAAIGAALPFAFGIPLAWILIGWSVNRVLRGLGSLSQALARRSTEAKEPLGLDSVPTEIAPLIGGMNSLIDRHQRALEMQRRFIADAAHELRTPLAALQLQIDNLASARLPEASTELIAELSDGVRRGSRLVAQLLTMARAEAPAKSERTSIDVVKLIHSLTADLFPMIEAREIELSIEADEGTSYPAVSAELETLLHSLIENAILYTPSKGSVTIQVRRNVDGVLIKIIDSGIGIPQSALPFIFDRFYRAAPQHIEGSGLGLSIARAIADRNGLRLDIQNRDDARGIIAVVGLPFST
jgi:two-component system, OmpR family, sensor kinase